VRQVPPPFFDFFAVKGHVENCRCEGNRKTKLYFRAFFCASQLEKRKIARRIFINDDEGFDSSLKISKIFNSIQLPPPPPY